MPRISSKGAGHTMTQVTVGRWGKNLAIRFPGAIVKAAGLRDGERVEIETHEGEIVIRRAVPHFTLKGLFAGRSPREWRGGFGGGLGWGAGGGRGGVGGGRGRAAVRAPGGSFGLELTRPRG